MSKPSACRAECEDDDEVGSLKRIQFVKFVQVCFSVASFFWKLIRFCNVCC